MNSAALITIIGTLTRWREYGDAGWGRGTLTTDTASVTVVGVIRGARPGDTVELTGSHTTHVKYGEQFNVTAANVTVPQSVDGVIGWISHAFPQVGPKRARALIDHFGSVDALWQAVEHEPDRLSEVPGITGQRALEIQAAFRLARSSREHGITLRGWGLTDSQISRCMAVFGADLADVVKAIREAPYELYHRVPGFGWLTADLVARRTGIAKDDPIRIRSALRHVLEKHTEETGDVFMRPGLYQQAVADLLGLSPLAVMDAIDTAIYREEIVRRGPRIYTADMERLEATLSQQIVSRGGYTDERHERNGQHAHADSGELGELGAAAQHTTADQSGPEARSD